MWVSSSEPINQRKQPVILSRPGSSLPCGGEQARQPRGPSPVFKGPDRWECEMVRPSQKWLLDSQPEWVGVVYVRSVGGGCGMLDTTQI